MPSLDPDTLFYGSDERRADFLTDDTPEEYPELASTMSVTAAEPKEVDGSSVQFYDVNVGGRAVQKRFKEFDTIHRLLRSAYADAPELLAKIPKLPNKTFGRTSGDEFVERRRAGLEELMQVSHPPVPGRFAFDDCRGLRNGCWLGGACVQVGRRWRRWLRAPSAEAASGGCRGCCGWSI